MKAIITSTILLLLLSGCSIFPKQEYPERNTYSLDVPRTTSTMEDGTSKYSIHFSLYKIVPEFSGRAFVYRQSDYKYVNDYYNNYVSQPALIITEQSMRWLSKSGAARILPLQNKFTPTHQIQATITQLYIDRRDSSKPTARVAISLTFSATGGSTPIIQKEYSASKAAEGNTAEAFAKATSQALAEILASQEADIEQALGFR